MTDSRITPFLFDGEVTVRVVEIDEALWFVAADVCRALGLTNPAETVKLLDDDEKGISSADTLGGPQELIIVSESGLFALIFRSRKPHAVAFRKWVTGVVLPSIRRTGSYSNDNAATFPASIARKPYAEWSLDEIRAAIALVNAARGAMGLGVAAWVWEYIGLPMPPQQLLPSWRQRDLFSSAA